LRIDELQIIKSALENDISWQKENQDLNQSAFKQWLINSETVLKKINIKLSIELVKKEYIENSKRSGMI
jgi:hypothetical protein